ncbi:MAG: DUF799 domain-containing protein [Pelomonas sp.]|nr:DUF799 domain-containing protein [Roseateles sp.]
MIRIPFARLVARVLLAAPVLLLGACATQVKPYDYTAYKQAKPASLLVLPPVNESPDVSATGSVLAQTTLPLAEAGYYVLPVTLVDETLHQNGVNSPEDAQSLAPAKLREVFGADAVLYMKVKAYGSSYKVVASETAVALEARLVDLRSGQLLWQGVARASSAENNGSNQGGLVGMLVKAVVEQIVNHSTDASVRYAGIADQRLLSAGHVNGLLYGPRSPSYGKDPVAPQ